MREGWLGNVFQVDAVMSRYDDESYRSFLAEFSGGAMYNFGSHLIDLVVAMLGRPRNVTSFQKATRDDGLFDNGLAVLEYPLATATVRSSIVEPEGMRHRRLLVCGTKGRVEICPLEKPWIGYRNAPLQVQLTLLEDTTEYPAGSHTIDVGVMNGHYHDQLIELARTINGDIENPYPYDHELHVQETLLAAAGYSAWENNHVQK